MPLHAWCPACTCVVPCAVDRHCAQVAARLSFLLTNLGEVSTLIVDRNCHNITVTCPRETSTRGCHSSSITAALRSTPNDALASFPFHHCLTSFPDASLPFPPPSLPEHDTHSKRPVDLFRHPRLLTHIRVVLTCFVPVQPTCESTARRMH